MRGWILPSSTEAPRWPDITAGLNAWLRQVPTGVVYGLGLVPFLFIVWETAAGTIGIDPVKQIEHRLGLLGLQFLIATLAVTPLRRFAGLNLLRFRRALGLLTFFYVTTHLVSWVVLDMGLLWEQALKDIVKRPYVTMGMAGFLLMLPLALTSNGWSLRRLGAARWRRLHQLFYPAAVAGAIHYVWLVKAWPPKPLLYLTAILLLLALRLPWIAGRKRR